MSKRVPFECEEGHITIKRFYKETVSEIVCEQEIKNMVMISNGGSKSHMARYIEWPLNNDGRKNEFELCNKKAVRF